jgi:inhibitor of cysteine peptidase
MIAITTDGTDRTADVPGGEDIVVTLPENPTTGYRWVVEEVTGDVSLVSSDFSPATDGKPGAGGHRSIHLRAGHPRAAGQGQGELRLRSERAWESASADVPRCRLTFNIA